MNDKTINFKVKSEGLNELEKITREIKNNLKGANKYFNNINKNEYEVITKEQFVKEYLCSNEPFEVAISFRRELEERWEKISKGFNFVIRAGKNLYSVDYFNEKILGNWNA
ncbi:hypothetical protein [Clostridium perfringens]|uniref:hypothetical protein n=1 Tax=Clostridium perfringens TaxID=1502 RepID=UPI002147C31F|nr:hypothetical protein [Clostridium perfringens]UUR88522.1 hypothetical protein NQ194_16550 [Clostridium perfringens]